MLCTPDGQSQTGLERVGTLSHQGALRTGLNFLSCDVCLHNNNFSFSCGSSTWITGSLASKLQNNQVIVCEPLCTALSWVGR